jgi:hypothetical protein
VITLPERPAVSCGRSFAPLAAIAAIASAPLAAGNLVAMLAAVHFDIGGMTNPLGLLHAGLAAPGVPGRRRLDRAWACWPGAVLLRPSTASVIGTVPGQAGRTVPGASMTHTAATQAGGQPV